MAGRSGTRMTETRDNVASVIERTRPIACGAPVVAAHFLGATAFLVLGEETVLMVPADGEPRRVLAHSGGILAAAGDGERVLTAGDDGKLVATTVNGETR